MGPTRIFIARQTGAPLPPSQPANIRPANTRPASPECAQIWTNHLFRPPLYMLRTTAAIRRPIPCLRRQSAGAAVPKFRPLAKSISGQKSVSLGLSAPALTMPAHPGRPGNFASACDRGCTCSFSSMRRMEVFTVGTARRATATFSNTAPIAPPAPPGVAASPTNGVVDQRRPTSAPTLFLGSTAQRPILPGRDEVTPGLTERCPRVASGP